MQHIAQSNQGWHIASPDLVLSIINPLNSYFFTFFILLESFPYFSYEFLGNLFQNFNMLNPHTCNLFPKFVQLINSLLYSFKLLLFVISITFFTLHAPTSSSSKLLTCGMQITSLIALCFLRT